MQQLIKIKINTLIAGWMLMLITVNPLLTISQPVISIDDYINCGNTEVNIPVVVENFEDIAALTIYISIDTNGVRFKEVNDIHEAFQSGTFLGSFNAQTQNIVLTWTMETTASSVYLDSAVMCNLVLLLKNGSSTFDFDQNGELAKSDLTVVQDVVYKNGSIVALSSFQPTPKSIQVIENQSTFVKLENLPDGVSCHWQENKGNGWNNLSDGGIYSGTQTTRLDFSKVELKMDKWLYRGWLSSGTCNEGSEAAVLFVEPLSVPETKDRINISIYPVPANDVVNIMFNEDYGLMEVRITTMEGKEIKRKYIDNVIKGTTLQLDVSAFNSGKYLIGFYTDNGIFYTKQILKK